MNLLELFVLSACDIVMFFMMTHAIFRFKKKPWWQNLAYILIGAFFTVLIGRIDHAAISRAISIMFVCVFFYIIFKMYVTKVFDYVIGFVLVLGIIYSLQLLVILFLYFSLGEIQFIFIYGLLAQSVAIITISIITTYINFNKLYLYINYQNMWLKSIMINSLLIYFTFSLMWDLNIDYFINSILVVTVTLLLVIVVNMVIIRGGVTDKKNKEKLEIYETYLPMIDLIIDEIKVKQHDYHNQVQTIASLKGLVEGATYDDYLSEISTKDIWNKLILLDNKILIAFFYSKYKQSQDLGVELIFKFNTYLVNTVYTDYELVEMFGILIDNAIEAAILTDQKLVSIEIDFNNQQNRCVVTNSVLNFTTSKISKMFDFYQSEKGDGRGIGLYKLKQLLDREKGTINVFYDTQTQLLNVEICYN
ncbi:MAG: GHKL domain-containing protein [Clostridiales bacterium]|nr:GHKL domain-containing protein [Clostridiales bacterium]